MLPTAINATFRYMVITPTGAGMYEGAGLVRLHDDRGSHHMHATLEDGDLRLVAASGYFRDALGPSRIHGSFKAVLAEGDEIRLTLLARRQFFMHTLKTSTAAR
ncbi:MAG: hypothetical protein ACP5O7_02785 [Phycisphaerae bacterium]